MILRNIFTRAQIFRRPLATTISILIFIAFSTTVVHAKSVLELELYNGYDSSTYYATPPYDGYRNGTYFESLTPNTHYDTGYNSDTLVIHSEGTVDYRSWGVGTKVENSSSNTYWGVARSFAYEDFTITGNNIGSFVNMSWMISTNGLISGNGWFDFDLIMFDKDSTVNAYRWSVNTEGIVNTQFLTPFWTYEIGKTYTIEFICSAYSYAANGSSEVKFIDTIDLPGVDIFTNQPGNLNIVTGSGQHLDVYFNSENPFAPVPEPSTMMLLGSGLVGLVGYGRRRFKK